MVRFSATNDDPRGHTLSTELQVAEAPADVFKFFSDPFQLETITPPWLHFSVESTEPIVMAEATLIDYRLRIHGLPIRWRSVISVWEPGVRFVDEQVRGPYRYWRHEHTFEPHGDGTIVRDVVRYAVPFGRLLHPLFVKHELRRIFAYRHRRLSTIFTPVDRQIDSPLHPSR